MPIAMHVLGPCMHTSSLPQPCVWDAWERKTRWRATLTRCSVGHCCTCHNTGHSSAKCDEAREHTQARLSDADRHACVGPCINSHRGYHSPSCGMHGSGRQRWWATHTPCSEPSITSCSFGHCCMCHNTGHGSAECDEVHEHTHKRG